MAECTGQHVGLAIWQSWVRFLLWPLAGFVLNCPEFKSSATLVNSQPVQPVGVFNPDMFYLHHLFQNYLSGVPAN